MPTSSNDGCKFLLRPQIHEYESFRGYVARIALRNDSLPLVRPFLVSLTEASKCLSILAQLTNTEPDVLSSHGALIGGGISNPVQACIGDARISSSHVRKMIGYVCTQCLDEDGISMGYWDLRQYSVCHRHGVKLTADYSNYGLFFDRDTGSSTTRKSGLEHSQIPSSSASNQSEIGLSLVLAKAYRYSLDHRSSAAMNCANTFLPIDWALLLIEFLEHVLIPDFLRHTGVESHAALPQNFSNLISTMLLDDRYRRILREAVFLHAAKDPLNMRRVLSPGNSVVDIVRSFHDCTDDIPFHECLWTLQRELLKESTFQKDQPQRQSSPRFTPKVKRRGGARNFDFVTSRYEPMPTQEFGVA
jgi:TniQ